VLETLFTLPPAIKVFAKSNGVLPLVTPAKAGVQIILKTWIPASAGMTDPGIPLAYFNAYGLEACPTTLRYSPILSVMGARLLRIIASAKIDVGLTMNSKF